MATSEEKEAKLLEKKQLDLLMSATTFFTKIYDYLSLELHSGVEKVHFQMVNRKGLKEREIAVFFENKAFPFCRCYVKFTENFFRDDKDEEKENEFANWILMNESSFSIPIDTINIIRKMKRKPGKSKSIVPLKFEYDENKLVLKYRECIDETGNGSDTTIRLIKGTTNYLERMKQYVEKPFIREKHTTDWIFDGEICEIYLTEDNKLTKEKTDKKLLEIASKDLYIKIKSNEGNEVHYNTILSEPDDRGCRWVMLAGVTRKAQVVTSQVMKVVTK